MKFWVSQLLQLNLNLNVTKYQGLRDLSLSLRSELNWHQKGKVTERQYLLWSSVWDSYEYRLNSILVAFKKLSFISMILSTQLSEPTYRIYEALPHLLKCFHMVKLHSLWRFSPFRILIRFKVLLPQGQFPPLQVLHQTFTFPRPIWFAVTICPQTQLRLGFLPTLNSPCSVMSQHPGSSFFFTFHLMIQRRNNE